MTEHETYMCENDSHRSTIDKHNLREMFGGRVQIVRVEVRPPDGNFMAPRETWLYHVDQDDLPAWYDAEECERRARGAVEQWWQTHHISEGIVEGWSQGTLVLSGRAQSHGQADGYCYLDGSAQSRGQAGGVLR